MELRPFGPGRTPVPSVGIGTWMMERDDRASAVAAIRRAIELGMSHIDTAEMYGTGRVEAIVGEAIRGLREKVFLVSKVLPSNASATGTLRACERSLKHLGTDHLDGYLLHWPGATRLPETFGAFERLVRDGKIRSWGVSNFDARMMERAVESTSADRIACNQVLYHLEERTIEHELLGWCQARGIAVVAYSPLGGTRFPESKVLDDLAAARGATPRQVALAFLLRNPSVFVIPKASVVAHVEEDAAAASIRLTDAEVRAIEEAFPRGPWKGLATA